MAQFPLRTAVVAGGTGLVGKALVRALLDQGIEVRLLTRNPQGNGLPPGIQAFGWDHATTALKGADSVFNLAGEGIADRRWSPARKAQLRDSRLESTRRITQGLALAQDPPKVLVNASAIGFYGNRGEDCLDETSPAGEGFLAETCAAWEAAADEALASKVRVVKVRTGVVLAATGGALPRMALPVRRFLGSPLGTGDQGLSWIHLTDLVDLFLESALNPEFEGPVNATAPEPLSNRAFTVALARRLRRPLWPLPPFLTGTALRVIFGEMAEALLLGGAYVLPRKAQELGYVFKFPTAQEALADLLP